MKSDVVAMHPQVRQSLSVFASLIGEN
jgi:hypothetical protein